jgi:hypothetical protein
MRQLQKGISYMNGFTILSLSSITWPWCISSVYRVEQPACNAEATIKLSQWLNPYFMDRVKDCLTSSFVTGFTCAPSNRFKAFSKVSSLLIFNLRRHTLVNSMITWVLTVTPSLQMEKAMDCLREVLSSAYTSTLLSAKQLSGIGFFPVKFKAAQVNGVTFPKGNCFFNSLFPFDSQCGFWSQRFYSALFIPLFRLFHTDFYYSKIMNTLAI